MILLEEALKSNGDYYHLISGFDLPLHDMDYIDDLNIKVKSSSISVNSVKQWLHALGREFLYIIRFGICWGGDANGLRGFSIELSQLSESIVWGGFLLQYWAKERNGSASLIISPDMSWTTGLGVNRYSLTLSARTKCFYDSKFVLSREYIPSSGWWWL